MPVRVRIVGHVSKLGIGFRSFLAGNGFVLGHLAWCQQAKLQWYRSYSSHPADLAKDVSNSRTTDSQKQQQQRQQQQQQKEQSSSSSSGSSTSSKKEWSYSSESLPPGWEDKADLNIKSFSELPHREFGYNQHMVINEGFKECLRQILWQFRAPIRYAFAYGSGVFPQSASEATPADLCPHPRPPEAITKWQKGGGKMIDFIFGVSHTEHWHSLNLAQHRDHYSALGSLGSGIVSRVQDKWGAGVYFNPYISVNGTLIKYGVANLDTICADLSEWRTLYLAGRLHKPVKILRDDARVRLANQINLISALRTGLLLLDQEFTEPELFSAVAAISYLGDPRMQLGSEHPGKVTNIVANQLSSFRQLYLPLVENLPNVSYTDPRCNRPRWADDPSTLALTRSSTSSTPSSSPPPSGLKMQQDMHPQKRANMVRRLPTAFRHRLYTAYQARFGINGHDFAAMMASSADEDAESGTLSRRQAGSFERRIVADPELVATVREAIRKTVAWPSTSQTAKGLVTAGWSRTWRYVKEKGEKSKRGKMEMEKQRKKK